MSPGALSLFLTVFLASPVILQISPSESWSRNFMRRTLPIMSMVITFYIPAEIFSRTVEHPCQFWIGTLDFRLSIFGPRQHNSYRSLIPTSAGITKSASKYPLAHSVPLNTGRALESPHKPVQVLRRTPVRRTLTNREHVEEAEGRPTVRQKVRHPPRGHGPGDGLTGVLQSQEIALDVGLCQSDDV